MRPAAPQQRAVSAAGERPASFNGSPSSVVGGVAALRTLPTGRHPSTRVAPVLTMDDNAAPVMATGFRDGREQGAGADEHPTPAGIVRAPRQARFQNSAVNSTKTV